MAKVVALSSLVARGHVGLSAMTPALQRLGHDVIGLPTVLLSFHPGHQGAVKTDVPAEHIGAMVRALAEKGWLADVAAVITGYLPSEAHVTEAAALIEAAIKANPAVRTFCDPVLGDHPKGLYIDEKAAVAIRDDLLPLASHSSPNAFELAWLSGKPVTDVTSAVAAARALGVPRTLVTSVPHAAGRLANLLVTPEGAHASIVAAEANVPHGTGDFMTAIWAAHCLTLGNERTQLGATAAATAALVHKSLGRDELALIEAAPQWETAPPLATIRIGT